MGKTPTNLRWEFERFLRKNRLHREDPQYVIARTAFWAGWNSRLPSFEKDFADMLAAAKPEESK